MTRGFGRDWGETYSSSHDALRGTVDVRIHSLDIADRLSEVIALLRRELASLRNRWVADLCVDLHAQWQKDPEAWKDEVQRDLEERIEDAKDHAQRRRDYLAFLERLQIYKLRQERGEEPLPEEFAAPESSEDDETDSDLMEPPAEGLEDTWESEKHPRWHDYYMTLDVCEEGVWVPVGFRESAERTLMRAIEKFPGWSEKDEEC